MKYLAVAGLALRQNLAARAPVIARLVFYLVLMVIFSRLWAAVGPRAQFGMAALVWYIAVTELVALGTPFLALAIEEDVKRGDVAYQLARPVSYLWARVSEGAGDMTVRFMSLATFGLLGAWFFAGGLPAEPRGLLLAVPLAYLAALVMVVLQVTVGLSAFWLHQATPLHWIVQKLIFVFGGLFFPLDIYPDWLREFALWTPFSAMLYGPARLVLDFDPAWALEAFVRLVAWGVVISAVAAWVYRRAVRVVNVEGG